MVRAAAILRPPEPFACSWHEVIGPVVWLSSEGGALLAIALDTWEVQSFHRWAERLPAGKVHPLKLLPTGMAGPSRSQPRFLWTVAPGPDGDEGIRVYDLAALRPPRVLPGVSFSCTSSGTPSRGWPACSTARSPSTRSAGCRRPSVACRCRAAEVLDRIGEVATPCRFLRCGATQP